MSSSDQEKGRERSRSRSPLRFKSPVPDNVPEAKETSDVETNKAKDTHHAEISEVKDVPDVEMSEAKVTPNFEINETKDTPKEISEVKNAPHVEINEANDTPHEISKATISPDFEISKQKDTPHAEISETKNIPPAETSKAKDHAEVTKAKDTPHFEVSKTNNTPSGTNAETDEYCHINVTNIPEYWTITIIKNYFKEHFPKDMKYFITIIKENPMRQTSGKYLFRFNSPSDCDRAFKVLYGHVIEGKQLYVYKCRKFNPKVNNIPAEKITFPKSPFLKSRPPPNALKQKMPPEPMTYDTYGLGLPFLNTLNIQTPLQRYVYVSNLRPDTTREQIQDVFGLAGQITSLRLFRKKMNDDMLKASIGYDHPVEAVQAVSMFHKQKLNDWVMSVIMDRKHPRPLPLGLDSMGPGLGEKGIPLRGVRMSLALKKFKEQFERDNAAAQKPNAAKDTNTGNDSSSIQQNALLSQLSAFLSSQAANQSKGNNSTSTTTSQSQNVPNFAQNVQNVGRNVPDCGPLVQNSGQNVQNPGQVPPNFVQNAPPPNFVQNTPPPNFVQNVPTYGQNAPNYGQNAQNYGQNVQNCGQNAPNYAQNAPSFGQNAPNYGQNVQNYGQPSFGQNASNFDQTAQNHFGQNALNMNTNFSNMAQQAPVVAMAQVSSNSTKIELLQQSVPSFSTTTESKQIDWNTRSSSSSTIQSVQNYSAEALHYMPRISPNNSRRDEETKSRRSSHSSRHELNKKPSDMLIFSNLPASVNGQALNEKMREIGDLMFGEVTEKGRAIVRFKNRFDAEKCIKLFDRSRVDGQTINVKFL